MWKESKLKRANNETYGTRRVYFEFNVIQNSDSLYKS